MIRWLILLALVVLLVRVLGRPGVVRRPPPPPGPDTGWDPWAVLGVPRGASRDAITRTYHEQMKRYHPDRVADLGAELQELAHRKTLELRRAYDELTR
ncbi:MAG TPA: J domain-containing protein [Candidatus Limnocylindria bacterium]|nr:J domain-containing protein [Candidatus Limnocylindria bacterium]